MVYLINKRQENVIKTGLGDKFVTQMNCNIVLERFIVTAKKIVERCLYLLQVS